MSGMDVSEAYKFPYSSSAVSSKYLSQVIEKMEENTQQVLKNKNNVHNLIKLMCKLGILILQKKCSVNIYTVNRIIRVLQKVTSVRTTENFPILLEFLELVYGQYKVGNICLSVDAQNFILNICPFVVEEEIFALLGLCCQVNCISDLHIITKAVENTTLVQICYTNSVVLKYVLSVMSYAWCHSKGHPAVGYLISKFTSSVENNSVDISHVCIPEVFHLTLPFSFSTVQSLPDSLKSSYIKQCWNIILQALESGFCRKEEVYLLMIMFPVWYKELLTSVYEKRCTESSALLYRLWKCDQNVCLKLIKRFMEDPWLKAMCEC